MNDDDLMNALGAAQGAREQDDLDPRWAQLTAGTLPSDEVAALEALARENPDDAQRWAMLAPLGEDFGAAISQTARENLNRADPPLQPLSPTFHQWAMLAACALVVVGTVVVASYSAETIPSYEIALTGGDQALRSEGPRDGPIKVSPGTRLQAVLRPPEASDIAVDAVAIAKQGPSTLALSMKVERDPSGTLRLSGTVGREVKLPPGEWQLVIILGRAGALSDWHDSPTDPVPDDDTTQIFEHTLIVTP